jgi:hypothetical protein
VLRQFNLLRTQSELVQKNVVASMDAQLYARLDSFNLCCAPQVRPVRYEVLAPEGVFESCHDAHDARCADGGPRH